MKRFSRLGAAVTVVSVVLALPVEAEANGRFPYANELVLRPKDPSTIAVRTTFGILVSRNAGASFNWICEPIIGFTDGADPGYVLFEDGSMAVGSFLGLAISHDNACSFPFATGDLDKQYVIDLALEHETPSKAVLLTATQQGTSTYAQVFETADNSQTWTKAGVPLDPTLIPTTLEVAPSRPQRLYVSGAFVDGTGRHGFLQTSDDRGATWRPRHVVDGVTSVYLAAVDPQDPDRAYARTFTAAGGDELLVTTDGWATHSSVLKVVGRMSGFALSPDGSKIAAGGPSSGTMVAARVAGDAGAPTTTFEQHSTTAISCLTWTTESLFACGLTNAGAPWVVAKSTDDGKTYVPVLGSLLDIQGPQDCPAGSPSANQCVPTWPTQRGIFETVLGLRKDAGAPADAAADAAGLPPAPKPSDGCSCGIPTGGAAGGAFAVGLAAVAALVRRLRRSR
jgi:hypothetical protein